jgi:predicted amidohydrolase
MKISIVQTSIIWENPKENRKNLEDKLSTLQLGTQLVVFPEMFSTGFTMNVSNVAETMQGETMQWLQKIAEKMNCAVTGSLVITENNLFFNRMVFVYPSGKIDYYDKKHLFSLAGEDAIYTPGDKPTIVEYLNFKINLQVCYDLRFPVFSRNTQDYDLLIYVASWPKVRINAWNILLKARSVENICYTIGVNRIGQDAQQQEYNGQSQVIDFLGNYIIEPSEKEEIVYTIIDKEALNEIKKTRNFLKDKDDFILIKK